MVRVGNKQYGAEIVKLHTRWLAKRTVDKKTSVPTSNTNIVVGNIGQAQDCNRRPFDTHRVPQLCTTFGTLKIRHFVTSTDDTWRISFDIPDNNPNTTTSTKTTLFLQRFATHFGH
jgi:hypothetical protein